MHSCIYEGSVRHRRFSPVAHAFRYSLFLMYVDLDELPTLLKGRWLWSGDRFALARFHRTDHLGAPHVPLAQAVRELVVRQAGITSRGPIRLLTHFRYFGYGFNPVSLYFCFDPTDTYVETIVAEVNNTPWGEQHAYVLDPSRNEGSRDRKRYRFNKMLHVSPFIDMDVRYDWRFRHHGDRLGIHMSLLKGSAKFFDATMSLKRKEITGWALARVLVRYPLMTGKVIAAIHFQALRLWLKRCPFYPHPSLNQPRRQAHPS